MSYAGPALAALVISALVNLLILRLARAKGWFIDSHLSDKPQRFHEAPTPRVGGLGILAGLSPLLILGGAWKFFFPGVLAFLSGIFEDFHQSLSPKKRLLLQLLAALAAIFLTGAVVRYLGFGILMPLPLAVLFSLFAIVGAMNAVNIIDGFNGLAGGTVALILISYAIVSHRLHLPQMELALWITLGALGGFLIYNFPKGLLFLGDGGAYLLGFYVAIYGIILAATQSQVSPWYILATLIYPVWEVIFSILRKLKEGKSPLQPDPYHFHMLIYRHWTRNNPATSVVILLLYLPFLAAATLYPNNSKFNFALVGLFILLYSLLYRYLRAKETAE